jgi:signal transduction histidine kinase
LRILQEAVYNAVKHSGAKFVEVQLLQKSGEIHLRIADSGRGFNVDDAVKSKDLGLTSMRERAKLINGTITIDSKAMSGTTIRVRVPLGHASLPEAV